MARSDYTRTSEYREMFGVVFKILLTALNLSFSNDNDSSSAGSIFPSNFELIFFKGRGYRLNA